MNINVKNHRITYQSAYKLFFACWCAGIGSSFFVVGFFAFFGAGLGWFQFNMFGTDNFFVSLFILLPITVFFQGIFMSLLLTIGYWVYQLFGDIRVQQSQTDIGDIPPKESRKYL